VIQLIGLLIFIAVVALLIVAFIGNLAITVGNIMEVVT
jgi:hypothetical protein